MERTEPEIYEYERRAPQPRGCDVPGCDGEGTHRAPRSRETLNSYYWFCLEHIRRYNRAWNYFAGMSAEEVERQIRKDTVWERPTWPFAGLTHDESLRRLDGACGLFDTGPRRDGGQRRRTRPDSPEGVALALFEVEAPVSAERLKARYKELVKLHHPDANGGAKESEERLKLIIEAYETLKSCATA